MRSVVLCSRWHFVVQVWGFTAGFWFTETHGFDSSAFSANADVANADIAVLQRRKGLPNPLGWLIPYPGRCGMLKSGIPKSTALSLVARQPGIQNPYILNHWVNPMGLDRIGTNCWQSWVPVAADVRPRVGLSSRAPRSVVKMALVVSGFGKYEMEWNIRSFILTSCRLCRAMFILESLSERIDYAETFGHAYGGLIHFFQLVNLQTLRTAIGQLETTRMFHLPQNLNESLRPYRICSV